MKFIFAGLFFFLSFAMSILIGRDHEIAIVAIATVLGYVVGRTMTLQKDLTALKQALAEDWEARNSQQTSQVTVSQAASNSTVASTTSRTFDAKEETPKKATFAAKEDAEAKGSADTHVTENKPETPQRTISETPSTHQKITPKKVIPEPAEDIFDKVFSYVKDYFTGGNLFVRVGIIILFFGVSFLLKYVSDRGMFPIEYRLIGVVVGAITLLGLGWFLRTKNKTYALLLQGAGIGVLYLDIYAAFSLYQLLPPLAAFALLFVVSLFSAALAVMQDSKSLAVLGFSGGFLAPVLASSGSNNHVGLFSYYAVLNLAIVAIAWFKAWRILNILGFAFTFIIGTAWGVLSYNSGKFDTTEPFLILFFIFYVLIAVLFALRQPPKLRGYVDGTLLFGVPLAASGLQYYLVKDFEYGVSLSSFAMGAFYITLSWFTWTRKGKGLQLLAEAFLALGVIFASMAIPFALAPTQTAAAWALEGAGLLWLGSRQNRLFVRLFGLLLQGGAGVMLLSAFENTLRFGINSSVFGSELISSVMMAVAGIVSARLLIKPFAGQKSWEKTISPVLLGWGLAWLFGGFTFTMSLHFHDIWPTSYLILLSAATSLIFTLLAMRLKPEWEHAWIVASGLFIPVLLLSFVDLDHSHPLGDNGWFIWPIVFGVYYFLLYKLEQYKALLRIQPILHSLLLLSFVVLVTLEGQWLILKQLPISSDWLGIWYVIPALFAFWMILKAPLWPFTTHKKTYQQQTGIVLAAFLALWSFVALIAEGKSDPLPWIPLLNPLDVTLLIVFISLFKWWQTIANKLGILSNQDEKSKAFNHRVFAIALASLVFFWLNFTLFRVAHHWFGIAYTENALYQSGLVQTSVSILWALSGVILTVYASRKQVRFLWMTGAILLGSVVLKLFVIDLSALDSLTRIVSFLVVGGLLTSIGYFAPLPDATDDDNDNKSATKINENTNNTEKLEDNNNA